MEAAISNFDFFNLLNKDEYELVRNYASFLIKNRLVNQPESIKERKAAAEAIVENLRKAEAQADKEGWLDDKEIRKVMGI